MRLNCYPHPTDGLWIPEFQLAACLKNGEAELCLYGLEHGLGMNPRPHEAKSFLHTAFHRLIWHNGLRIKKAIAREMKWLGISLLFAWAPFRHWLEEKAGVPGQWWPPNGYLYLLTFMVLMVIGALAEILYCIFSRRSLRKRFEHFKIVAIRHFPGRPRPPVSRTDFSGTAKMAPNLKCWAAFLIISLIWSCIVPISSTWIVVHPLGGQDYAITGPSLIRPFSSWYTVPQTCATVVWIPLQLLSDTKIKVFELEVEWQIEDPLDYRPKEWRITLDRAMSFYLGNIMENLLTQLSVEMPEASEDDRLTAAVSYIALYMKAIRQVIEEQLGSPVPMKILGARVRTVSMKDYTNYYIQIRQQ